MLELKQVLSFVTVAEELHFSRAAERLHMAQPPLSQHIKSLERDLGVMLFERNTRSVRLTDAGRALLPHARSLLEAARTAERAAAAQGTGEVGRVSIAFAGATSHAALPVLAQAVRKAHPGIELELQGATFVGIALNRIVDREVDLGFVRLPISRDGIVTHVFQHERLIVALPADHPLAALERVPMAQLASEGFVSFPADRGSSLREHLTQAAMNAGFTPRIVQEAPDTHTILALVAAGVGVSLTVSSVAHIQQPGLVFRELDGPTADLQAAFAWRSDNASPALRAVLDVIATVFKEPVRIH